MVLRSMLCFKNLLKIDYIDKKQIFLSVLLLMVFFPVNYFCERNPVYKKSEIEIEAKPSCTVDKKTFYIFDSFKPKSKSQKETVAFIEKHYELSIAEFKIANQPASVKLAQAILESNKGKSYLARNANNFFGVKCFKKSCPDGHCLNRADDFPYDRFVVYADPKQSFRKHSVFLTGKRYKPCRNKDWVGWCDCLQEKNYATAKNYSKTLKKIIIKYKLYEFDN